MRWFRATVLALLAAAVFAPGQAAAADFRSGTTVIIGPSESIDSDLYIAGTTVQIEGTVRGDVFAAGQTVIIAGRVEGGVTAAGGTVEIRGQVTRGVRAAAGAVRVEGQIVRDLLVAAGSVDIASSARIGGDVVLSAGSAAVAGAVEGSLLGSAGEMQLTGTVSRNVDLDVGGLTVGPSAQIGGSLRYRGERDAVIQQGAQIADNRGRIPSAAPAQPSPLQSALGVILGMVRSFLGLVALGLVWLLVAPASLRSTLRHMRDAPLPSLGVGFLSAVVVPWAIILLLVAAILFGLGPLLAVVAALFALGLAVAGVVVAFWLGGWVLRLLQQEELDWLALLIGSAILAVVSAVPFFGGLIGIAVAIFGLGGVVLAAWGARRAASTTLVPSAP